MSDSFRFSSPSRKSRFRSQSQSRPAGNSHDPGAAEEEPAEAAAVSGVAAPPQDPEARVPGEELAGDHDTPHLDDGAAARENAPDALPAGLRLTRDPNQQFAPGGPGAGKVTAFVLAALVAGAAAGYFLGKTRAANSAVSIPAAESARDKTPPPLTSETQAAIDAAFADTKNAKYQDARKKFEDLFAAHPEWPSLEVEAARAALYARDFQAAHKLLKHATENRPLADAALLAALIHLTAQEYVFADDSFASSVAIDPARADVYYFWGENLRREGKPLQAAEKFKAALARNQYENAEPLYQLKYWLSLIQSDRDGPSGEAAKIDASLHSTFPTSAALFAAAARALRSNDYKTAADFIAKARTITDPTLFNVVLHDPTFLEENIRPELAPFYNKTTK